MGFEIKNGVLERYTEEPGVTEVVIPDGVTEIGERAFQYCRGFTSIIIPDSVKSIGACAFRMCRCLADNNGYVIIRGVLYDYCGKDSEIVIPNGVTSIGDDAFYRCMRLTSVTIPDGVTSIGCNAFADCCSLTSITIPDSVTTIEFGAFSGCSSLANIKIPDGVTKIGVDVFVGCRTLTSIAIPESVKKIEVAFGPFYGCSNLRVIRMSKDLFDSLKGNLFSPSSKMITLELTDGENPIMRFPALFRKDYPTCPTWLHSEDYLVPVGSENISLFDNVLAAGTYDGFNTNEDGRIQAILYRLLDKQEPIQAELNTALRDFLSSKLTKVMKYALIENAQENVRNLIDLGVIAAENEKKVSKILEKSEDDAVKNIASVLKDWLSSASAAQEGAEEQFQLEEKYQKAYKKSSAASKMVRYGIEIPEIKAADGNGTVPKEYLELFIAMYMEQAEIIPLADEAAQMYDRKAMNEVLLKNYEKQSTQKNKVALVNAVMRFADDDTVRSVYNKLTNQYNETAVLKAILLNDSKAAMMIADKKKYLGEYAKLRGTDADTLRDTVLVDFGLDSDGKKEYNLGGTTIIVSLQKDLSLGLFDTKQNKTLKSIPKKGNDEALAAAASADLSGLKKNIKKAAQNRGDKLFKDFLSGDETDGAKWKNLYFANPLLRCVAELVVWKQGQDTFTLKDNTAIKSNGDVYVITDDPVCVAHPIEMKPDEVNAWQKYFLSNGLKQPFAQMWEKAIDPATVKEDRYTGCVVPMNFFRGAEKHGLSFYDYDYHNDIGFEVLVPECKLEGERTEWHRHELFPGETFTLGKFTFRKYTRKVNHLVTVLDRWTVFDRIVKDDVSVESVFDCFTVAQITEFIAAAQENNAVNVTSLLLNYKNTKYPDVDPFAEFTLDLL